MLNRLIPCSKETPNFIVSGFQYTTLGFVSNLTKSSSSS